MKELENYLLTETLGIKLISVSESEALGEFVYDKRFADLLGHMPGAIYNAVGDAVGGAMARATGDMYVTQNCSMQFYVSTENEGEKILAKAVLRHRGSRTCIAAVELSHEDGTVISDGQFSYSKI